MATIQPNANTTSSSVAKLMQFVVQFLQSVVALLTGQVLQVKQPQPGGVQDPAPTFPVVTLDEAMKLINPMSRPLAEIANTISNNLTKINQCLETLEKADNDEDLLKACLMRDVEVLQTTKLSRPRTVCTSKSCTSIVGGVIEYSTVCHDPCGLTNVPHDTIGHPALKDCTCMQSTANCKEGRCRCSYLMHQHITYSSRRVVETRKDPSVQKQIDEKRSVKAIVHSTLKQLAQEMEELKDERNKIGSASAQLTVFLQEHGDDLFVDMIDKFLESMVEQRRHANQLDSCKELEKLRQEYQDAKKLLEEALQEQKKLLEAEQASMSSSNSSPPTGWTGHLQGLWNRKPTPPKPLTSGQPAQSTSFFNGLANLNPLRGLWKNEPAPTQPFGRQPAPPPKTFLGSLANLNPFSKSEPAPPPPPKPLKLKDVMALLAELDKLPLSGTSLREQLQAQK